MRIYLDKQYGLNSEMIKFTPYCKEEIKIGNYIKYNDYILRQLSPNYFRLLSHDSILGSDLLNNEWKIKKI